MSTTPSSPEPLQSVPLNDEDGHLHIIPDHSLLEEYHPNKKMYGKKFSPGSFKYMDCLKNHAAHMGRHATDGCGEYIPDGEEGTIEALRCSACDCHRNFHRKVQLQPQFREVSYNPNQLLLSQPSVVVKINGDQMVMDPEESGMGNKTGKKRFRTKFTQEQKERMLSFAEKVDWKMPKLDDSEVRAFCQEMGIKRKVLKVWMHNNKYQQVKKNNETSTD